MEQSNHVKKNKFKYNGVVRAPRRTDNINNHACIKICLLW